MLIIDGAAVRRALPMGKAIEVMRGALRDFAEGRVYQPPRSVLQPPGSNWFTFLKPALVSGDEVAFGLKVITLFPDNPKRGLPAISGFVALFDAETGLPLAVLDGGVVTEIRTGAVSAVATDLLAAPDAGDLAILGAGAQARAHLLATAEVRPLRRMRVWTRDGSGARTFASWAKDVGHEVETCPTVPETVAGADIVCTVTSAREALLDGDWVAPGAHINAVGAFERTTRELHTNLVKRATVVVDSREEAAHAAGDLLIPVDEGVLPAGADYPELGEVLVGKRPGRHRPEDVTVFESLGMALEDVAGAAAVVTAAHASGLGAEVSF